MFGITGRKVCELRAAGGELFTAMVDALIRAHCRVHGISDSEVDVNIRTSIPDGGVDTVVRRGTSTNDQTGWLTGTPTIWQYKATEYRNVELDKLLKGRAVEERVQQGHAFRLAVADGMPPHTKQDWERMLTDGVREIHSDAPESKVTTADDLATWVSRYPGLVMELFRPAFTQITLHLEAWRRNIVQATPKFVPVADWQVVRKSLEDHVDFQRPVPRAVAPIQGEAGGWKDSFGV